MVKVSVIQPENMRKRGVGGDTKRKAVDLAEYYNFLVDVPIGGGALVTLDEGEDKRTTKRRFTLASRQFDPPRHIKWGVDRADGTLLLKVVSNGSVSDGGPTA